MKAHRAEIEKQETKKLAEKIAEDLKQRNLKVNMEDLENLDADKLVQIQLKQLEQERQELASKLKQVSKRHDFLERAMRKEEIPLLKKDFEDQRKLDRAYYVALKKAQLEASKIKHVADMKFKERLLKIKPEYDLFRAQLTTKRDAEYAVKVKEAAIKLEEAKEKRRKEHAAKKEADRVRREREAEEEKKRIEMEKIEAEKRKQEEAERAERDRIKRQEDEERLR